MEASGFFSISHSSKEKQREIRNNDWAYRQKSDQAREETRLKQDYVLKQAPTQEELRHAPRSSHQIKGKLLAIRDMILEKLSNRSVYKKYDRVVQTARGAQERNLKIHHSYGTKLIDQGHPVLEIDCAGSSFKQFRKEHTGFHGEGKEAEDAHFEAVYGKKYQGTLAGQDNVVAYMKKKTSSKTGKEARRITLAGPGATNTGTYQMDNVRDYILALGSAYLERQFAQGVPDKVIHLNIQGHSRGAVAAVTGVKELKKWLYKHYPLYADKVQFNLIQHDAVPGFGSGSGEHGKIDLREEDGKRSKNINATSICSISADRNSTVFTPQEVRGQRRMVLMAEKHGVGLDQGDGSQADVAGDMKYHRPVGFDASTMEAYRGSGYSELPDGIWLRDEFGVLVRMRSYGEAMDVIRAVTKDAPRSQKSRLEVVSRMIKNWFIDNEFVDDKMTAREVLDSKQGADAVEAKLMESKWGGRDRGEMQEVKQGIAAVHEMWNDVPQTEEAFQEKKKAIAAAYDTVIAACKKYMEAKDPSTDSGKDRLEMVSKLLSQYRIEKEKILPGLSEKTFQQYQHEDMPPFDILYERAYDGIRAQAAQEAQQNA